MVYEGCYRKVRDDVSLEILVVSSMYMTSPQRCAQVCVHEIFAVQVMLAYMVNWKKVLRKPNSSVYK